VRVKEEWCAAVPASLPLREAAAVPLVGLTAWQALQAAPQGGGRRILILGASGGVGQFAVQLACLRGLHVTGTCGADHAQLVRDLGASDTFDYAAGCDALGDAYGSSDAKKFDVVLDLLGGDLMRCAVTRLLKPGATVIHVRNRGADEAMVAQLQEEVSQRGCAWHSIFVQPSGEQLAQLAQLIEAGKLRVHVAAVMPLEEVAKAHELVETGHAGGKVVLKVA
jgi:NADPH:quinone reductase-like Zn-dependent oxidoreductase